MSHVITFGCEHSRVCALLRIWNCSSPTSTAAAAAAAFKAESNIRASSLESDIRFPRQHMAWRDLWYLLMKTSSRIEITELTQKSNCRWLCCCSFDNFNQQYLQLQILRLIDWLILIYMIYYFKLLNNNKTKTELLPISLALTHPYAEQCQWIFLFCLRFQSLSSVFLPKYTNLTSLQLVSSAVLEVCTKIME